MEYIRLLGTVKLLKLRTRLLTALLISCSTLIFAQHLLFIIATAKYPASQRYDIIKRNVARPNIEITDFQQMSSIIVFSLKTWTIS